MNADGVQEYRLTRLYYKQNIEAGLTVEYIQLVAEMQLDERLGGTSVG